jgi:hypothetical protein
MKAAAVMPMACFRGIEVSILTRVMATLRVRVRVSVSRVRVRVRVRVKGDGSDGSGVRVRVGRVMVVRGQLGPG